MASVVKPNTQEELLKSIAKGDNASFCALYDTYSGVLFGMINKMSSDQQVSEEILQLSFVRIWQSITTFKPEKQRFLAWMLSITRKVAEEILNAKKLNKPTEIQTANHNVYGSNKEVLLLIYFKGYSLQKVAELLNLSLEDVKIKLKTEFDLIRAKN